MDFYEQTDAFSFELDNLVERYMREFDINAYTLVGVMEGKQQELLTAGDVEFTSEGDDLLDFFPDEEDEE